MIVILSPSTKAQDRLKLKGFLLRKWILLSLSLAKPNRLNLIPILNYVEHITTGLSFANSIAKCISIYSKCTKLLVDSDMFDTCKFCFDSTSVFLNYSRLKLKSTQNLPFNNRIQIKNKVFIWRIQKVFSKIIWSLLNSFYFHFVLFSMTLICAVRSFHTILFFSKIDFKKNSK